MEPLYTIKSKLEKKDHIKFMYVSTFFKKPITFLFFVAAAVAGGIGFGRGARLQETWQFFLLGFGIFALLIFFIFVRVRAKSVKKIIKDKTGNYELENTFKFFPKGMILEGKKMKTASLVKYEKLYRVIETRDYFMIYFNEFQGSLFKKSQVENCNEFQDFLRSKFTSRRYYKIMI